MPQFYFHLVSAKEYSRDEIGSEFATVDEAWLEAHRAAQEMSCEFIRQQTDPRGYRFEITNAEGRFLIDLPFSEITRGVPVRLPQIHQQLEVQMSRCRKLREELHLEFAKTRATLTETRLTLSRARSRPAIG